MKQHSEFYQRLNHLPQIFLLAAVVVSLAAWAATVTAAADRPRFMFVQTAKDLKVDPAKSTFRLVKVNQQTLYFTDRPKRLAGHISMADYLKEWTARAGKDNFAVDPPNATLSIYEPGNQGVRSGPASMSKSRSFPSLASPRAAEPNTRMLRTPWREAMRRISCRFSCNKRSMFITTSRC